jgi:hypothetical protein
MNDISVLIKAIRRSLSSSRSSLTLPLPGREVREDEIDASLAIERVRLSFPFSRTSLLSAVPFIKEIKRFNAILGALVDDPVFRRVTEISRFRNIPSVAREDLSVLGIGSDDRLSVYEVLRKLHEETSPDAVRKLLHPSERRSEDLNRLRKIIPSQKIAPLRFSVSDGRLILISELRQPIAADVQAARAAQDELARQGSRAIEELKKTNCDKRLIDTFSYLQERLLGEESAIQVGLANSVAGDMCRNFREELPIAVTSMLESYTRGVDLYVSQFPEWNRFVENAATSSLTDADVSETHQRVKALIKELAAREDLVDGNVPQMLERLNRMLSQAGDASKRAAFAVLRSIENMVSSLFTYGVDFLEKTAKKVSDDLSSAVSKTVVVGLLTLALGGAITLTPVAGKISQMSWVQNALELVEGQIKQLRVK